jgi:hypothetical protein
VGIGAALVIGFDAGDGFVEPGGGSQSHVGLVVSCRNAEDGSISTAIGLAIFWYLPRWPDLGL